MSRNVAIVGSSMAGLGTAIELLKGKPDFDVEVYERKKHPSLHIVCGGAISTYMVRELGLHIPSHMIAARITGLRMHAPNGEYWHLESENEPYGYVLWREMLENYFYRKARKMGAKFNLGCQVLECRNPNGVVVGADGLTGCTRKQLHLKMPQPKDIHSAVQTIAKLPSFPHNQIDLYFNSEFAPEGYAWIFPDGVHSMVRIGLGISLGIKKNPVKLLRKFMDYVGAETDTHINGKLVPTALPERRLVHDNVLLVGDAGLLCDPATGGGIANALLSGKYAARAILENNLDNYQQYCSAITKKNKVRYGLKQMLFELSDDEYNELIDGVHDFHPRLTHISWAIAQALTKLFLRKPKLMVKHRILKKLMGGIITHH